MKDKKKWKKLRKMVKICRTEKSCNNCEIKSFCDNMGKFAGASVYYLLKVENYLKGFEKI